MTNSTQASLAGKVAVVTGGGRDIGRACALRLAASGAAVAINYHSSSEGADSAVAEITGAGGQALARQGDMTDADDPRDLAGLQALVAFGDREHDALAFAE